ncbi:MAG TPA: YdcF family protein [Mucilaginibacter sp.]|jgi:uncharacterized SAM-binding protein YcdF (DUF218 family)
MYFIFSKILLFILFPLNWIFVCLLLSWFFKQPKLKRKWFVTGMVLLIIFSNPFLLRLFAGNWDIGRGALNKNKTYSAAIILGGFSGEDKNGKGIFNEESDRFIEGVRLKKTGRVSHILVSSGNGNLQQSNFREAAFVKSVLHEINLPDTAILIDQNSRNTFENAEFSKRVLQKAHLPPPYLLVTSAWHMRRALYIFKKTGLDVIAYPSGRVTGDSKFSFVDYIMPDAGVLIGWNLYLKETVGLIVAHLK